MNIDHKLIINNNELEPEYLYAKCLSRSSYYPFLQWLEFLGIV